MSPEIVNNIKLDENNKGMDKNFRWLILIIILIFLITKLPNFFLLWIGM